jgi:gluconolactonase
LTKGGELKLLTDKLTRPNGIALSPDEKTLYVANSDPNAAIWMAFTLDENRNLVDSKVFFDATGSEGKGLPDGLKVDRKGNIWATGPGGVFIFDPDGNLLGKINTGEATSNCAFNTNQDILFMTCDDYLMQIHLK